MTDRTENILLAIQGASFVGMIVALAFAVTSVSTSRYNARYDSCYLLRGIVYATAGHNHHARATAYLNTTSLKNCIHYANTDN